VSLLKTFWRDDRGAVYSMDVILVSTILVLGMIAGLVCLRNQVLQEFTDVANAVGSLDQSYSYTSRTITSGSFSAYVAGGSYTNPPYEAVNLTFPSPSGAQP
jgi:Flp pilus assembly pilin Flp